MSVTLWIIQIYFYCQFGVKYELELLVYYFTTDT